MSAWERARYIPWSRIPKDPDNLEQQKERIFRDLQREASMIIEDDETTTAAIIPSTSNNGQQQQQQQNATTDSSITTTKQRNKLQFSGMELFRQAAFGGCIGSITGSVFGFMDGMRTSQESVVLKNASNMAKGRYLFQGTTRSATLFGIFFAGFHMTKYGIRVVADQPGDLPEMAGAALVSTSALMYKPAWRPSLPYAVMLIVMDGIHIFMRKTTT